MKKLYFYLKAYYYAKKLSIQKVKHSRQYVPFLMNDVGKIIMKELIREIIRYFTS